MKIPTLNRTQKNIIDRMDWDYLDGAAKELQKGGIPCIITGLQSWNARFHEIALSALNSIVTTPRSNEPPNNSVYTVIEPLLEDEPPDNSFYTVIEPLLEMVKSHYEMGDYPTALHPDYTNWNSWAIFILDLRSVQDIIKCKKEKELIQTTIEELKELRKHHSNDVSPPYKIWPAQGDKEIW